MDLLRLCVGNLSGELYHFLHVPFAALVLGAPLSFLGELIARIYTRGTHLGGHFAQRLSIHARMHAMITTCVALGMSDQFAHRACETDSPQTTHMHDACFACCRNKIKLAGDSVENLPALSDTCGRAGSRICLHLHRASCTTCSQRARHLLNC